MIGGILKKVMASVVGSAVMAFTLSAIPTAEWVSIGQKAAAAAVGLAHPQASVELLKDRNEPNTTTSTTATMPFLGTAMQVPTTTPVPPTVGTVVSGGGKVLTQRLSTGSSFVQGVAVKNNHGFAVDVAASLSHKPALAFDVKETAPQVLIVHTHTTECYLTHDDGVYAPDDATRTDDPAANMVAVGKALTAELKKAGIGVIHDTAIHDQPYTGAYGHSKASIEQYLKEYPTIRVVLDLHRDAIYPDDNTRIKPTAVIDGKKAAQVMIIVGMLNSKSAPNPHVTENLAFAVRLQQRLHTDYEGLMRPLNLANARYNQQLTNGSLLLEMGSDANTLEEAVYAAQLVGKGLVQVLLG
ncbi:MAG: stage II sporulation protein P [Clostridia bacterium]|nr:stage II sporulation protein P [Clostridia bacterium]